jgi:hypothetical protein
MPGNGENRGHVFRISGCRLIGLDPFRIPLGIFAELRKGRKGYDAAQAIA